VTNRPLSSPYIPTLIDCESLTLENATFICPWLHAWAVGFMGPHGPWIMCLVTQLNMRRSVTRLARRLTLRCPRRWWLATCYPQSERLVCERPTVHFFETRQYKHMHLHYQICCSSLCSASAYLNFTLNHQVRPVVCRGPSR